MQLLTEYSLGYAIVCLAVGGAYAWLLYQKDAPWSRSINRLLTGVRFALVAALCFLLLGPYVRQVKQRFEKPTVVFAIDDSESLPLVLDSAQVKDAVGRLAAVARQAEEAGFDVRLRSSRTDKVAAFGDLQFDGQRTDLAALLQDIQSDYENRNLDAVVLLSDGIYNQGVSPDYLPYAMRVHTVGIGDTLPQTDLNLKAVYANKIAYLGNRFPVVAEINNTGFVGEKATVKLSEGGQTLEAKEIEFTRDNQIQNVEFLVSAEEKGTRHYVVEVAPKESEFTKANNVKHVYLDILDGKEKILLVASAPHPDIKALKSAIEANENYELVVYIPVLHSRDAERKKLLDEKYDLTILHQVPSRDRQAEDIFRKVAKAGGAAWYILGTRSDLRVLDKQLPFATFRNRNFREDRVTGYFEEGFDRFTFGAERQAVLPKYPPVTVPFGTVQTSGNTAVMLRQQYASVQTDKPLFMLNEADGRKTGLFLGEGLWQWRLAEYNLNGKQETFDELVTKTVQYLSTKEDKRKFRVYPSSDEFFASEPVTFETEVYNDIYEKIYGQQISLTLTDEEGTSTQYDYRNAAGNFKYLINGLRQGIYRFKASTTLDGKQETVTGQFAVKELALEALNTTADFNLLRKLADRTDGGFYTADDLDGLAQRLAEEQRPDVIHSQEELAEAIGLEWIFAVLFVLAAFEWFMRKIKGGY